MLGNLNTMSETIVVAVPKQVKASVDIGNILLSKPLVIRGAELTTKLSPQVGILGTQLKTKTETLSLLKPQVALEQKNILQEKELLQTKVKTQVKLKELFKTEVLEQTKLQQRQEMKLELKQLQKLELQQKQKQQTKTTQKQQSSLMRLKPKLKLKFDYTSASKYKQKSLVQLEEEAFTIYTRKFGKDVSLGTATNKESAKNILSKELLGTARASGYIEKGKRKLSVDELGSFGGRFMKSKKDSFRVIQAKNTRLGGSSQYKEVQSFKRGKSRLGAFL